MNGFDDPRDTDRLKQLCEALGEPYETPSEHRYEPPYRMTWERALDLVGAQTQTRLVLLTRAEEVDAEWLNEYRRNL